ncbi:hypothetical protein JAAARDRAFT_135772 [Jaapia argillacea MUCL 33604]|uniref:FAD-binding PCMH-type domain-containing protein n=1 Tax=Jaapia argillacea MUCL 33604 TaxID=933084 RepID=A0A067PKJ7_9AGAM|nr:hypothetical protein JAAARDRAFT_135772 [Jaapia argillacea MUCL 33604]
MSNTIPTIPGFKGDLVAPSDPSYSAAISRWAINAARPAHTVAFPTSSEDTALAIKLAREQKLPIAIKGGGHSASGASSSEGGLVIDLSRYLNGAEVDVEERVVRVGGGALWDVVDKKAIEHGFATVGGTVNHVRLSWLILGGGYGWLSGAYGLAIDNLVQATVAVADGSILTANSQTNPDLFWGIRGGGCNFGVVTEFVLKLYPQRRTVFGGLCVFAPTVLDKLVEVTQEWWKAGPGEKEGMIQVFTRGPDAKPMVGIFMFYNGSEEEGRTNYKKFFDLHPVVDMCHELPYEELNSCRLNKVAVPGRNVYMKGAYHTGSNPDLPKILFERVMERSSDPSFIIVLLTEYFPLGRTNSVPNDATAFRRGVPSNVLINVIWEDDTPERSRFAKETAHELGELINSHAGPGRDDVAYGNYSPDQVSEVVANGVVAADKAKMLFGSNYPRMQRIKKKYDPEVLFSKWFAISPAA